MRCGRFAIPLTVAALVSNCIGVPPGKEGGDSLADSGILILLDSPREPFVLGGPMIVKGRIRNVTGQTVQVCPLDPERAVWEAHGLAGVGTAWYEDGKLVARKEVISCFCESLTWVEVIRIAGKPREADDAPRELVEPVPRGPGPELTLDLAPGEEKLFEFDLMKADMGQEAIDAPGRFTVSLDYSYSIRVIPSSEAVGKPSYTAGGATSNTITVTVLLDGGLRRILRMPNLGRPARRSGWPSGGTSQHDVGPAGAP